MDCQRDENNYCPKKQCFVDDRGCAKCDGNPKMPQPVKMKPPPPLTELQIYFNTCKGICEACGECACAMNPCQAGHYETPGVFCHLNRWPEPPHTRKRVP